MDPLREKIAKLLALALDQAGKPEGDLAAARAMRMMEQHGISEGEVRATNADNSMTRIVIEVPKTGWVYSLQTPISRLTGTYIAAGRGEFWIIGRRTDAEVAEYLFDSLKNQCNAACSAEYHRRGRMSRFEGRTFRDSWLVGLNEKVRLVLDAQKSARGVADNESLVPFERGKTAEAWARANWRFGTALRSARGWDQAGRAAGRSATVNPGVGGSALRQLGSGGAR